MEEKESAASSGVFTPDMLHRAMAAIEAASFEPFRYVVHPREKAWAENPVGEPPSAMAVHLGYGVYRTVTQDQINRWLEGGLINP